MLGGTTELQKSNTMSTRFKVNTFNFLWHLFADFLYWYIYNFTPYQRTQILSGPGCSKLTMLLVNVSVKFKMLISEISQYFVEKGEKQKLQSHIFFNKTLRCIFGYNVVNT